MLQAQPRNHWLIACALLSFFYFCNTANASDPEFDLESLMSTDVQVTSAMKRAQPISNTASSIYVLTNKDLLNAGVQSIPQALNLVPGMQVRQINNNQWAITARFAGGRYSSNLLVLIDGQSVYNPTFAGVYWENIDVPIQDVERIEVIRGQTGTLWGVNASNGVVNIITKNSLDTQEGYATVSHGSDLQYDLNLRYGGTIGDQGSYRVYSHHLEEKQASEGLSPTNDTSLLNSMGMRVDYAFNDDITLFSKWNILDSAIGQTSRRVDKNTLRNGSFNESVERNKFDFLIRVEERISKKSNHMLQFSINKESGYQETLDEEFRAADLEYQINTLIGDHQIDMGLYYRYNDIELISDEYITNFGNSNKFENYGGFFQAQLNVIPDKFHLVLGNMSAYNDYTGWENQPSFRTIYKISPSQTVWFNASKAVRVPSYLENNIEIQVNGSKVGEFVNTGNTTIDNTVLASYLRGSPDTEAEETISYEAGYRLTDDNYSLDLSIFKNTSNNTLTYQPSINTHAVNSAVFALLSGDVPQVLSILNNTPIYYDFFSLSTLNVTGLEAVFAFDISPKVDTELSYSVINLDYDLAPGQVAAISHDSTLTQLMAKLNVKLPHRQSLNINVKSEKGSMYSTGNIFSADIGWRWKAKPNVTLAVNAWNLFSNEYEYLNTRELHTSPTKVNKSVTASLYVEF